MKFIEETRTDNSVEVDMLPVGKVIIDSIVINGTKYSDVHFKSTEYHDFYEMHFEKCEKV